MMSGQVLKHKNKQESSHRPSRLPRGLLRDDRPPKAQPEPSAAAGTAHSPACHLETKPDQGLRKPATQEREHNTGAMGLVHKLRREKKPEPVPSSSPALPQVSTSSRLFRETPRKVWPPRQPLSPRLNVPQPRPGTLLPRTRVWTEGASVEMVTGLVLLAVVTPPSVQQLVGGEGPGWGTHLGGQAATPWVLL